MKLLPMFTAVVVLAGVASPALAVTQSTFAWEVSPIATGAARRFSRGPSTIDPLGSFNPTFRVRAFVDWSAVPQAFLADFRFDAFVSGASPGDRISNFSIGDLSSGGVPIATYFPDIRTFTLNYGGGLPPGQGNSMYWVRASSAESNWRVWGGLSVLEFDYTLDATPGTRTFSQVFRTIPNAPPGHHIPFLEPLGSFPTVAYLPPTTIHEARVTVLPAPATLLVLAAAPLARRRRR